MRKTLIVTAAVAVISSFTSIASAEEPIHYAGGPTTEGHLCWVSTNGDLGFGYWQECPTPTRAVHKRR